MAAVATDIVLPAVVPLEAFALFTLAHRSEVCLGLDAIAKVIRVFDLSGLRGLLELPQICVCRCPVFGILL